MNFFIQILLLSICYIQSKSVYLERGVLINLFFINSKNKYKNNQNWTLLTITIAEIININKFDVHIIKFIAWEYLYWFLLCISIINIYTWKILTIYCILLLLFPIQTLYLQYIYTVLYTRNIVLLLIKRKYYRLMLIFIKSIFNFDVAINRIFHKKETTFLSWIYHYIPFYNNDIYEYVPYYNVNNYIKDSNKYIYATNIYSNKIINNINNFINEKFVTEAITLLRITFLFYYNYYVYKLEL
jgi:hypothetical protein